MNRGCAWLLTALLIGAGGCGTDAGGDADAWPVLDVPLDADATSATDTASDADAAPGNDLAPEAVSPRTFTVMTFNVGTTEKLVHDGDPDGYGDALADVAAAFYGNNLAWVPAREGLRTFIDALKPDIIGFQELYWDGHCAADCAAAQATDPDLHAAACTGADFVCGAPLPDTQITVRRLVGPDYAVACAPNHPDNCVAVRKAFGALADCPDGPCIGGLDGMAPPNGCTGGARVATAVVQVTDGPQVAVVDVHTVSGSNVECRTAQLRQVFENRGDDKPAAFGAHNIVLGDMNIDPFLIDPLYDASVAYWNDQVGAGRRFHYLSSPDSTGPNTHPSTFMKLDHVISDNLDGSCVVLGVSEGTLPPVSEGSTFFDHRPVYCTVTVP